MYYIPPYYEGRVIITEYIHKHIELMHAAHYVKAELVWLAPLAALGPLGIGILFDTSEDCIVHILKYGNKLPQE